jgi:hypothetical protein
MDASAEKMAPRTRSEVGLVPAALPFGPFSSRPLALPAMTRTFAITSYDVV